MNDGQYIIIELGAGFAAIIAFLVTFLSSFRRWVLDRVDRDGQRGAGGGTPGQARDPAPVEQAPRQPERRWINQARSRIVMEFVPLNAALGYWTRDADTPKALSG
jgi:hypothetical protein